MTFICKPTDVPPANEIDIPALKEKYRHERDRRIRPEGQEQYAKHEDHLTRDTYEHDPFSPVVPRDSLDEEIDVAILGCGWTGILAAYNLTRQGVTNFRAFDHAGNWGGTWYWNRYPGIQCDNDAYCYLPLLEETGWLPSKKFSDGKEIYDYIQMLVDKFGFREKGMFHTLITGLRWDETIHRWRISTDRHDEVLARFVVMAGGTLSTPKFPNVPGIHRFNGHKFHTSRWDYDYTGGSWDKPELAHLADKRVAILGTGATSVQAVPYLARYAKQLYVLQRTPCPVDERANPPTDPEWARSLTSGWQARRQENFLRAANEILPLDQPDLICDFWTEINRNINEELKTEGRTEHDIADFWRRREVMDFQVMERIRRRCEEIVKDPDTAEVLKPWYRFMCKRPLSNNDYYEAFNRSNVKLIDVSGTQGLEAMTERGFIAGGREYEIDAIIFASGFEVTSDLKRRWGIETFEGRGGVSIYDHWAHGPETLHGITTHKFPNMFFTGYVQGGLNGTTTLQFGTQVSHAAWMIRNSLDQGIVSLEPTREGQDDYVRSFNEGAPDLSGILNECTPSYFTNEGDTHAKWFLFRGWGRGWDDFVRVLENWRNEGQFRGMRVEKQFCSIFR